MELSDLKTLIAVVEQGGITRAAKYLNRVPSSITTRIMQLEDNLGVQLFIREGKRLLTTDKGQLLYNYAKQIIELAMEAELQIKSSLPKGKLRIGAMESTAAARLPNLLAKLHLQYPQIELELTTGTSHSLYQGLLANQLDAVFIADTPKDNRLDKQGVFKEQLVIVAPKDHAAINTPQDIHKKTLLVFKDGCSYRDRLVTWFVEHDVKPERIAELSSYHAILGGVSAGMGIGIVPEAVLKLFPDKQTLSVHQLSKSIGSAITDLVWRKGMLSANISALQSCLTY
ncbi:LysR substrate-binding domain-containing protein [Entomomonas asaccharolytica]|uniref:LysR family transcriptional regulator n=1 Tax=Entomomonas asaccharolytica TaxID=2785331 RepID=A0A974NHJ3_9GAMM|nr:LysR substrate-binding domain-containing protein [Entomomonas asaccharolytica]QQP86743.1 LysR family transcriptional regulator [Entomomonas asaccharolytica]